MTQESKTDKAPHTVTLQPSGVVFDTTEATTLLMSALQAGIRLPHSCRNGSCRTCLCKLNKGQIRYVIEWPGLTREEKAEGYLLPCVAVAITDVELEVADVVFQMTLADEKKGVGF